MVCGRPESVHLGWELKRHSRVLSALRAHCQRVPHNRAFSLPLRQSRFHSVSNFQSFASQTLISSYALLSQSAHLSYYTREIRMLKN